MWGMIEKFKQNRLLRKYGHAASIEKSEAFFWEGTERERSSDKMVRQMSLVEVASMLKAYDRL